MTHRLTLLAILFVTSTARADATTAAADKLVRQQFTEWTATLATSKDTPSIVFAPDAKLGVMGLSMADQVVPAKLASELFTNSLLKKVDVKDVRVSTSADGNAEWVYFVASVVREGQSGPMPAVQVRGSELISKHGDKWLVDGGMLSVGNADAAVNNAAKAGTLGTVQPVADSAAGDADVLAAFTDFMAKGFDATATARKDLLAVGSGPGELTTTGKGIAPYFKQAWVGHATVSGPLLGITAPSKTTACVIANVNLPGGTKAAPYQLPFRLFVVFDKTATGWSPVHVHFAVASPH